MEENGCVFDLVEMMVLCFGLVVAVVAILVTVLDEVGSTF